MDNYVSQEDLKDEVQKFLTAEKSGIAALEGPDWICKVKGIIIAGLNIAIIFVGSKEKEVIRAVIEGLKQLCGDSQLKV